MNDQVSSHERAADQAAAAGNAAEAVAPAGAGCLGQSGSVGPVAQAVGDAAGHRRRSPGRWRQSIARWRIRPLDFSALLSRAFLLERAGDPRAGEAFAGPSPSCRPTRIAPPAMRARRSHAPGTRGRAPGGSKQPCWPRPASCPAAGAAIASSGSSPTARAAPAIFTRNPAISIIPACRKSNSTTARAFPGSTASKPRPTTIRAEFEALMAAEAAEMVPYIQYPDQVPLRQWQELNHSRDWSAIHLIQNGAADRGQCPPLSADDGVLVALPAAGHPRRIAQCDVLAAGAAHAHPAAHRRRQYPAGLPSAADRSARLRLPGRRDSRREWREGEAFVFDDTIEHEAWNDSDQLRVVLIFDLWPPALERGGARGGGGGHPRGRGRLYGGVMNSAERRPRSIPGRRRTASCWPRSTRRGAGSMLPPLEQALRQVAERARLRHVQGHDPASARPAGAGDSRRCAMPCRLAPGQPLLCASGLPGR